jgi:hypothetical protein
MFSVTAYLSAGVTHAFNADSIKKAREIASRIITEGLWVVEENGDELFVPAPHVFKVKVVKQPAK